MAGVSLLVSNRLHGYLAAHKQLWVQLPVSSTRDISAFVYWGKNLRS